MEDLQCVICQQPPLFPVNMNCFPCSVSQNNKPSCWSFTILCKLCADRYLNSGHTKKCLYCSETIDLTSLDLEKAYTVNFLMMRSDLRIRECPFTDPEGKPCDYRGTHLDVWEHIRTCAFQTIECPHCFASFYSSKSKEHKKVCPFYTRCRVCTEYILDKEQETHVRQTHHALCCVFCNEWFLYLKDPEDKREVERIHQQKCTHRIYCRECHVYVFMTDRHVHFQRHCMCLRELIEKYQELRNTIRTMDAFDDRKRQIQWIEKTIHTLNYRIRSHEVNLCSNILQ